jgi:outer membrane protein OmpA-like peptidoglycan-associated protein
VIQGEQDPPALPAIQKADSAIQAAKQAGADQRFPDEYAALETRYLETRGVFYACQENKALEMANALIADANALATKRVEMPPPAMPLMAKLVGPEQAFINTPVEFDASGTTAPNAETLTYHWDFGDGTTATTTTPTTTHTFAQVGNYTVRVTADDGHGGTNTADTFLRIVQREQIRSDVLFDFDQATLKPGAETVLQGTVDQLKSNPSYQVELVGHTDSTGPEAYNMALSERRAKAVQAYLAQQGIEPQRITADWKGESDPVAPNDTKEGRAQNRRTDIIVNPLPAMQ